MIADTGGPAAAAAVGSTVCLTRAPARNQPARRPGHPPGGAGQEAGR
jgi:hypothetical protein